MTVVKNPDAGYQPPLVSPVHVPVCDTGDRGQGTGPRASLPSLGIVTAPGCCQLCQGRPVGTSVPPPSPPEGQGPGGGRKPAPLGRFLGSQRESAARAGRASRVDSPPSSTLTFQEGGLRPRRHQRHLPPGLSRTVLPRRKWNSRKGGASPWVGNVPSARVLACSGTPDSQSPELCSFVSRVFLLRGCVCEKWGGRNVGLSENSHLLESSRSSHTQSCSAF